MFIASYDKESIEIHTGQILDSISHSDAHRHAFITTCLKGHEIP
jgi:hypothetical protein